MEVGGDGGQGISSVMSGSRRDVSLAMELARLRRVKAPDRRVRLVCSWLSQVRAHELALAQLRDATVRELRQMGWSHAEVAEVTGLTRARVAQISRRRG